MNKYSLFSENAKKDVLLLNLGIKAEKGGGKIGAQEALSGGKVKVYPSTPYQIRTPDF